MKTIISKKVMLAGGVGLVLGALIILGIRFATYKPVPTPHYHANFAVYVNGTREQFTGMQYYEETATETCSLHPVDSPKERGHMHDNINDVVHVEDHLVTWGNFIQNLGWGLGDDYLKTIDNVYVNGTQGKLSFILNGKPVDTVAGQVIQDKDKLLISYGNDVAAQLQQQYKTIPNTAAKFDTLKDPGSCGAGHHDTVTLSDRMHHMF